MSYGEAPVAGTPATCPDCGRPVPAGGARLCRHCGYPLMFEAARQAPQPQPEYLRKPTTPEADREREPGFGGLATPSQPGLGQPGFGQPVVGQPMVGQPVVLGPHCPACGHRNAAQRVRCEVCAAELWPGAAAPPKPPQWPARKVSTPTGPRIRLTTLALVVAAVAAVAAVYLLAYALA